MSNAATVIIKRNRGLLLGLVLTLVLFNIPYGRYILYPFSLLSTFFHEMGHGMTASAAGADFTTLILRPDTSGQAQYMIATDTGRIVRGAISSAGYVGTAVVGCGLLTLRRWPKMIPGMLGLMAFFLFASLWVVLPPPGGTEAWWISGFGSVVVIGWGLTLAWVAKKGTPLTQEALYHLIALQTALNAILNIRPLYGLATCTDAVSVSKLFYLPPAVWATIWGALAVILAGLGFYWGHPEGRAPTQNTP